MTTISLSGFTELLGEDSLQTIEAMRTLGQLQGRQQKFHSELKLFNRVITLRIQVQGKTHQPTIAAASEIKGMIDTIVESLDTSVTEEQIREAAAASP